MALAGEINKDGEQCPDCNVTLDLQVLQSGAGYYIGTFCNCGPYSRESDYFRNYSDTEAELRIWQEDNVRPHGRDTGYHDE